MLILQSSMVSLLALSLVVGFIVNQCLSASNPNILFILADDLGWGNVGWNLYQTNNPEIITPNMNKLATKEGLILNRHYVHYLCTPTRSSFQSGRLPCHVCTEQALHQYDSGIPENMTTIAVKMKQANYSTHMVGKYDIGWESYPKLATIGRGYDTFFGYLRAMNDYWTQQAADNCYTKYGVTIYDLWENGKPAYNQQNKKYESYLFEEKVINLIENEFTKQENPFFMVYTPHLVHAPQQIPKQELNLYDNDESECSQLDIIVYPGFNNSGGNAKNYKCRSIYESMVTLLDKIVGNVTQTLKDNDLWNNTLVIFSSDNGGPLQLPCCSGNNYPLRGGKQSPWEGGIRGAAFVTGGYLPKERVGATENGMVHVSDWYTTFCEMVGVNPFDEKAAKHNLPPVEGYNIWPLIAGINETSPRTQLPVDETTLIDGDYKFIIGGIIPQAAWGGPHFPNTSTPDHGIVGPQANLNCSKGCLFDLISDMTEHVDISEDNKNIVEKMNNTLNELIKGYYRNDDVLTESCPKDANMTCECWMAVNVHKMFLGPYCDMEINQTETLVS